MLFLMFFYRTLRAARRCPIRFGYLLAFGLGMSITFQALTNMAVAVRLFPTTGQPIPIVSYGGTSILFTSIAIGMILAVSKTKSVAENE
jgi:cell division protein FtsW